MIDFKQFAPVTREESFGKILNYAKKQSFKVGAYISDDGRKRCAVGVLLPTPVIKEMRANDMLKASAEGLCEAFGASAIKRVTGMNMLELERLQIMNDEDGRNVLLEYCRKELAKIQRRNAKKAGAA